ncbi:MAG: RND transporter, partial [Betaproteobacteria bacterium]
MKLAALLASLVIAGCATAPALDATRIAPAPAHFKEGGRWTAAAPAEAQPRGEWWKAFSDPALDDLVARADRNNASIQVAAARLAQARALAGITDANRAPQLGAGAGVSRFGGVIDGATVPAGTLGTAGATLSYELDLFGKLSRASEAARLDAEAREGLLQSTRLLVQAEVAQAYLALRAVDAERAIVNDTL